MATSNGSTPGNGPQSDRVLSDGTLRSPGAGRQAVYPVEAGEVLAFGTDFPNIQFEILEDNVIATYPDGGVVVIEGAMLLDPPAMVELADGARIALADLEIDFEVPEAGDLPSGGGVGEYEGLPEAAEDSGDGLPGLADVAGPGDPDGAGDTGMEADTLLLTRYDLIRQPAEPLEVTLAEFGDGRISRMTTGIEIETRVPVELAFGADTVTAIEGLQSGGVALEAVLTQTDQGVVLLGRAGETDVLRIAASVGDDGRVELVSEVLASLDHLRFRGQGDRISDLPIVLEARVPGYTEQETIGTLAIDDSVPSLSSPGTVTLDENLFPMTEGDLSGLTLTSPDGVFLLGFGPFSLFALNGGIADAVPPGFPLTSGGERVSFRFDGNLAEIVGTTGGDTVVMRISVNREAFEEGAAPGAPQVVVQLFEGLDHIDADPIVFPELSLFIADSDGDAVTLPVATIEVEDAVIRAAERDTGVTIDETFPQGESVSVTIDASEIASLNTLDEVANVRFSEGAISELNGRGITSLGEPVVFRTDPASDGTTTAILIGEANGEEVIRLVVEPTREFRNIHMYEYTVTTSGLVDPEQETDSALHIDNLRLVFEDQDGDTSTITLDRLSVEAQSRIYGTDGPDILAGGGGDDVVIGKGGADAVFGDIPFGQNLIVNPGFENHPELSRGTWGTFSEIEGWVADTGRIEIHEARLPGVPRPRSAGDALLELDAHSNSVVRQTVDIEFLEGYEAATFELTFDYAGRNTASSTPNETSTFRVLVNGQVAATFDDVDDGWQTATPISITLTAAQIATGDLDIAFEATGTSDAFGALIDDVALVITGATGGQPGDDVLQGGAGDDLLVGGEGADILYGNEGDDRLYGGDIPEAVDGNLMGDAPSSGLPCRHGACRQWRIRGASELHPSGAGCLADNRGVAGDRRPHRGAGRVPRARCRTRSLRGCRGRDRCGTECHDCAGCRPLSPFRPENRGAGAHLRIRWAGTGGRAYQRVPGLGRWRDGCRAPDDPEGVVRCGSDLHHGGCRSDRFRIPGIAAGRHRDLGRGRGADR